MQPDLIFLIQTDVFFFSLSFPSPQLRMSFIVFSTEGTILMRLTEDRWVQISFKKQRNSEFEKEISAIPDCFTGYTVKIL